MWTDARGYATVALPLWLTDITEHPTREGKVYCAVVVDAFAPTAAAHARRLAPIDLLLPPPRVDRLVHRPGNAVMILAREKQAGQGRREGRYAGISARPRTQIRRSFAAARARTPGTEH